MRIRVASPAIALTASLFALGADAAVDWKIATDSDKSTHYVIGNDLARHVAPAAGVRLSVLQTPGAAANIKLLRYDSGVKLAIVQNDVLLALTEQARAGHAEAGELTQSLRVVTPLFDNEIHLIARADSPMNFVHDMREARISGGVVGSGAALTTHALYRRLFGQPIPETQAVFATAEEALVRLITDKSIDVVAVVGAQPAPLIANMKPEAQKFIKLLKFDPAHAASKAVTAGYVPARLKAASYPNLLAADIDTLAVGTLLATYDYPQKDTAETLGRFGRALCQNFTTLQAKGHPKWKEADLALPQLPDGWRYFTPAANEIKACLARQGKPTTRTEKACGAEERALGLCK
ncbi:MAG: C4-dicarboxylate ABC transporter substrate-binding protein [Betaproteobacteria bacterium]|nr:C4-dicarboxylate ABC transporter substrate-binding protein [Betaproteobacteria bacterium]